MAVIPGLDLSRLRDYLDAYAPHLSGELNAEHIAGGQSNRTYFVSSGPFHYVLRRPTLVNVLKTAHDMAREVRVIKELSRSAVTVPESILRSE